MVLTTYPHLPLSVKMYRCFPYVPSQHIRGRPFYDKFPCIKCPYVISWSRYSTAMTQHICLLKKFVVFIHHLVP